MISRFFSVKNVAFLAGVIILLFIIPKIAGIVMLFYAAYVLACAMDPFVEKLQTKLNNNRTLASIIVVYTFFGGYLAVCWTDLLQGLLMMIALICVPLVMLYHIGGINEAKTYIQEADSEFNSSITAITAYTNDTIALNIRDIKETINNNNTSKTLEHLESLSHSISELQTMATQETEKDIDLLLQQTHAILDKYKSLESLQSKQADFLRETRALLSNIEQTLQAKSKEHKDHFSFFNGVTWISIISALAWGLGYFGQTHIIVLFMSIRSTKDIPKATFIGI